MSDPTEPLSEAEAGTGRGTGDESGRAVTAVIDAYHDPDPERRGIRPGEDADAAFERRLGSLVGWAIDNGVAFDRAWTIRTDRLEYDVMAEFVYLANQPNDA